MRDVSGVADAAERRGFGEDIRSRVWATLRAPGAGPVICSTVTYARGEINGRECGPGCGDRVARRQPD